MKRVPSPRYIGHKNIEVLGSVRCRIWHRVIFSEVIGVQPVSEKAGVCMTFSGFGEKTGIFPCSTPFCTVRRGHGGASRGSSPPYVGIRETTASRGHRKIPVYARDDFHELIKVFLK